MKFEKLNKIYFTVTNQLVFDQRMRRICTSLANAGYNVVLVGRSGKGSVSLSERPFQQKRLFCFFNSGKLFYFEYNLRLFFYLLFRKASILCAIDLDTIVPVYMVSALRSIPRVYDAHELFCEMKEVVTRPSIYKFWKTIERRILPKFNNGYTVCAPIANEFQKEYHVQYEVIRNMPELKHAHEIIKTQRFILYQGAVNEGRCFETLIPAMRHVDAVLMICGNGNFMQQAQTLVKQNKLDEKIVFRGLIDPEELRQITTSAYVGVTLFENNGMSNYFSLANRFFDYIHAEVPQIAMNFPCYAEINAEYEVAVLLNEPSTSAIAAALNNLLTNDVLYDKLQNECIEARKILNWDNEEQKLLNFYKLLAK